MKRVKYFLAWGLLGMIIIQTQAQKINTVYIGTLRYNSIEKLESVKKDFSEMLDKIYYINIGKSVTPHYIPEDKGVIVKDDKVSFNITKKDKYIFLCSDKQNIKVSEYSYLGKVYQMTLSGLTIYWKIKDLEFAQRFADDLVYFQSIKDFVIVKNINHFDSIAAKYRALQIKPPMSEEVRKYIVQANSMTQEKNYKKAIEIYETALEIDPANPLVYNNQALLFAIIGRYDEAINRMKKYLMLLPDAPDARKAQDQIYEWEVKTTKQ